MSLLIILIAFAIIQPGILLPELNKIRPFFATATITTGYWLVTPLQDGQPKIANVPQNLFMVGLIVGETVGYFFQERWVSGTLSILIEWLKMGIIYLLIANIPNSIKDVKRIFWIMIIGACFIVGYAAQIYYYTPKLMTDGRLGSYGMYEGANDFGLILVCSWPLIFRMFEVEKRGAKKIFLFVLLLIFILMVFLTISRGAILGLSVCVFLSLFTTKSNGRVTVLKKIMIIPFVLALVIIVPVKLAQRPDAHDFSGKDASAEHRIENWKGGAHMMLAKPLGVGFGNFHTYVGDYGGRRGLEAHNTYIKVGGEAGFLGLFCYLSLLYITVKHLLFLRTKCSEPSLSSDWLPIVETLLISLIGFMICTFFSVKEYELLLYIIIGLTIAVERIGKFQVPRFGPKDIIFVGGLMTFFFALIKVIR